MKKITILAFLLSVTLGYAQISLPIDFETTPITSDFTNFDGGIVTIITNPQSVAPNTSANVAKMVRNGGQIWAGSYLVLASNLDFSTLGGISMKVFTTAPVGTDVKFKLQSSASAAATEKDVLTTVTNGWETLTWDFTGQPASTFNTLVFMFDFGNLGDGSANSTFLFDDIKQVDVTGGLSQIDLPVDFEGSTVNYTVTDFGGNASSLVVDSIDANNKVIKTIKTNTAATWAGTTIGTASGFKTAIPLTLSASKMTVRVWSPNSGTPIRLKVEDSNDATHTCETETNTTVTGGWENLEFDFANQATGTAALNPAFTFNKASIFFNFGTDGVTAGERIYYFDNVRFGSLATLAVNKFELLDLNVYPNPTNNHWMITSKSDNIKSVMVYDLLGRNVISLTPNKQEVSVDASGLATGIYLSKITTDKGTSSQKLIKN